MRLVMWDQERNAHNKMVWTVENLLSFMQSTA
jgi:hypothetical protein